MATNKTVTETTWFISHNGAGIIHYGFAEGGTNIDSGQPIYEEFPDEKSWKTRLTQLNVNVESKIISKIVV